MYVDTGYELGQNIGMGDSSRQTPSPIERGLLEFGRCMLWIDGVGAYLICFGEQTTIGGPHRADRPADVALLANLSGLHATIIRGREGYLLEAHSPVRVAKRTVDGRALLNDGYEIELGSGVRLKFRLPTVLSMSAVLEFVSDHRPTQSVDGIILMDETCLLGAGSENHIRCADWSVPVLLYRREGTICCKSRGEVFVDNHITTPTTPLRDGQIVSGTDFSFRIEALRPAGVRE